MFSNDFPSIITIEFDQHAVQRTDPSLRYVILIPGGGSICRFLCSSGQESKQVTKST